MSKKGSIYSILNCNLFCIYNKCLVKFQFNLIQTIDERYGNFLVMLASFGVKSTEIANSQALTYQKERNNLWNSFQKLERTPT